MYKLWKKREENIQSSLEDSFSLQEKIDYFKRKWRRDHRSMDVLAIAVILCLYLLGWYFDSWLQYAVLLLPALYSFLRNNAMMAYVEAHAFDGSGKQ